MISVLAVALAVSLAVSATDTFTRIPGTRLGLGMTENQLKELGEFTAVKAQGAEGATPVGGTVKFFGVPCTATLFFRSGVLERAHLEAQQVAPHTLDYVEDQMRREKLWRECLRLEPADRVCDWIGAVKIKLEFHKDRLDAMVSAVPRPWETEVDSTRNTLAAAPPTTRAPTPASAPAKPPGIAAATPAPPAPATTTPASAPVKPPGIAAATPAPPASATTTPASVPAKPPGIAAATPAPPAPASQTPAKLPPATPAPTPTRTPPPVPVAVAPEPAGIAVATLPETLRISLPERNPPSVWPRMSTIPPLEYPADAKRDGLQGVVWVMTLVDADGSVRSTHIDRGIPALNDAALAWVSKARFAPCDRDGRPCRFWVRVAARFTLE